MADIVLQRIGRSMVLVPIEGTAPLLVNKFSAKARQLMLDKQMGQAVQRQPKDPEELYQGSRHRMPNDDQGLERDGFPATGFKAAIVNAARYFKGSKITMELLKQAVFVKGEGADMLVPLLGQMTVEGQGIGALLEAPIWAKPESHEANVRNETGVADIRFRAIYYPWSAWLPVVYISNTMTAESVVHLVDAAGNSGIGEWRPASKQSKTGNLGTWIVPESAQVTEIKL